MVRLRCVLCRTENGEAFVCGQNDRGQLGLGHSANVSTLQLCHSLSQRVTKVACGWDFTLFLTGKHHFTPQCTALFNTEWIRAVELAFYLAAMAFENPPRVNPILGEYLNSSCVILCKLLIIYKNSTTLAWI